MPPGQRLKESGLEIELPPGCSFRLADCPTYRKLCGQRLKEMDFGWCREDGSLVLLEVKQYRDFRPREGELLDGLERKFTDSLLLLLAAWAGVGKGRELLGELPSCAQRPPRRIRLVVALDFPPERQDHLLALRHLLREELWKKRLQGRARLAGAGRPELLRYEDLAGRFPELGVRIEER